MFCQFLLYCKTDQLYVHIYPLFWSSFPFSSSQSTEQSSLCYTVGSPQLSVLYIILIVYISQFQSPNLPHLPSLPLGSICLLSMPVSLFLLCKQVHLHLSSRLHMQASIHNIYFSLSDITLYNRLWSIHVSANGTISFIFLG